MRFLRRGKTTGELNNAVLRNQRLTQICGHANIMARFGNLQIARFNEEAHYGDVSDRNCRR